MPDHIDSMRRNGTPYEGPHRFERWYSWRDGKQRELSTCAACGRSEYDEMHDLSEVHKLAALADKFRDPKKFAQFINMIRRMDKDAAEHLAMWAERSLGEYADHAWWLGRVAQECWKRIETFPRELHRRRQRLVVLAD